MQFETSQLLPTIIGIALLGVFGFWYHNISKSYPNLTFGDIINKLMVRQHISFILGLLFAVGFSEALFAATIHIVGEAEVNIVARMLGHGSMQLASVLTGARAAALLRIYLDLKPEKRKESNLLIEIFICSFIAILSPFLNYIIIAGGLNASDLGVYAFHPKYAFWAFKQMPYALKASTGLLYFHVLLLLADVANILGGKADEALIEGGDPKKEGKKNKKDINERIEDNNERAGERAGSITKDNIKYLLSRYKFKNGKELNDKLTLATDTLLEMDAAAKQNLAREVARLKDDIEDIDIQKKEENWSEDRRQKENNKIRDRIAKLFAGAPTTGKGFGITLPQRDSNRKK